MIVLFRNIERRFLNLFKSSYDGGGGSQVGSGGVIGHQTPYLQEMPHPMVPSVKVEQQLL